MSFLVGVPTLSQYERLDKCLNSIFDSDWQPARVFVVDNGGKFIDREGVEVYRPGHNLGVSASWNVICREAFADGLDAFILNDDVTVHRQCFGEMMKRPELIVLAPWWSCFAIDRPAYEKIGPFDEQFYPAYCEDTDYMYRAKLAGVPIGIVEGFVDHAASSTVGAMTPEEKAAFLRCNWSWRYYREKWGGDSYNETYKEPFNGAPCPEMLLRSSPNPHADPLSPGPGG